MNQRVKQEKIELRQSLRQQTDSLPEDYLAFSDQGIQKRLLALDAWEKAHTLFIYISMKREPNTLALIQSAIAGGKTVAVPRIVSDGEMEACVITSLDALHPGHFGIPEPDAACTVIDPQDIDLAIVPCIAADRQGYRLGHGGGYYDRYLQKTNCTTACLCRGKLLQKSVPHDTFDIPVKIVVTEQECIIRQ